MKKIILASQSPRRKELLAMTGFDFEVCPSHVEEVIDHTLTPSEIVKSLAYQKGSDVFKDHQDCIVVGSDTIVVIDDKILGKPKDKDDAKKMMQILRNRAHQVITGVAVISKDKEEVFADIANVHFNDISDEDIDAYVETSEAYDKAGAYAIQGWAARYISAIEGNYYTIMGLPLDKVYNKLKEFTK